MTTQINPVTIPREVADAIKDLRGGYDTSVYSNADIAYKYSDVQDRGRTASAIRKIPFDTLMRALLDGYERELTEEEAREKAYEGIRFIYAHHENEAHEDYSGGFCDGIEYVLNTLGIELPGVNIPEGGAA
ncbi:hypothetical protein [Paenibacillus sp. Marseille-Q9583]